MEGDRITAIEQELLAAKGRHDELNTTLQAILGWLNNPHTTPATPPIQSPTTQAPTPKPTTSNAKLRPAVPTDFSGDQSTARSFFNSCLLYIKLCSDQFPPDNEQIQIHWALSYFKSGRTEVLKDRIMELEIASGGDPVYASWAEFAKDFRKNFFPENEAIEALNRLESEAYHQGRRSVEEYLDEFQVLVEHAGYTDDRAIVMKFRRGLDPSIQNKIADAIDAPDLTAKDQWYTKARLYYLRERATASPGITSPLSSLDL